MRRISLVKSAGISMPSYGYGDDRRFGRLFQQTWRRLRLGVRRRLLKFWREGAEAGRFRGATAKVLRKARPDGKQMVIVAPRVELLHFLPHLAGSDAIGSCNWEGSALVFLAEIVDALPDEAVMTLIAHEVAHAYLRAIGFPVLPHDEDAFFDWEELEVRELVECWGFDEWGLDDALQELPPMLHEMQETDEAPEV